MKKICTLLFATLSVFALCSDDNFISEREYGKQLYENPRGVACVSCHGFDGTGSLIAKYKNRAGKEVLVVAPDITGLDFIRFRNGLVGDGQIMPRYHLTDREIEAIYNYISGSVDYN